MDGHYHGLMDAPERTIEREVNEYPFLAPAKFEPPVWIRTGHAQTVLPYFMRDELEEYSALPHHVDLGDGDVIVLHDDEPVSWQPGGRVVMLVHGLGGCHSSTYMMRITQRLLAAGVRVVRMDMRGCGAGLHLARQIFHAARQEDLRTAVDYVHRLYPTSPITVSGFSLGANLTLKMLGLAGDNVPAGVDSAVVVEPPIDLAYCCEQLRSGMGWSYDLFFARMLWRDFTARRQEIPGAMSLNVPRPPRTIFEFDVHITSKLAGYASVEEYYEAASAKDVLAEISVPTAVLTAVDDPIVPVSVFDHANWSATSRLFVVEGGGHLGFYASQNSHSPQRDHRWMDWQIVDWVSQLPKAAPVIATQKV